MANNVKQRNMWAMHQIFREARRLLAIASPVVATQLGMMSLGVVDTLMLGRVSREALAAAALGNAWVISILIIGMGAVLGIDPLISQAHGAGQGERVGFAAQQGIGVALLVSIPACLMLVATGPALVLLGQDPALAKLAHRYALVQIPATPAFLVFAALRQYLQGRAIVTPAMWIVLGSNLINLFFNWILIFGKLGAPTLGIVGSGISTSLTRIFLVLALTVWIWAFRLHEGAWIAWTRRAFAPRHIFEVLRFGLPVAAQLGFELWAFQIATLMAGRLGATALAGHSIVLNLASVSFMVPLGISIAAATRVGNLIGAQRPREAQRAAFVAFGLGGLTMSIFAIVFVLLRNLLPALYMPDDDVVISLAATLLPIAAAFQLFDGIQVVGSGILRGMGRTVPPVVFNVVAYYLLALPLGWWLASNTNFGVRGIWWGLCLGLAIVALLLFVWISLRGPARVDARII